MMYSSLYARHTLLIDSMVGHRSRQITFVVYYLRQGGHCKFAMVVACLFFFVFCLLATMGKNFRTVCMKFTGN